MKNAKRILMLVLAMAMLITALPVGATGYFPYINSGTSNDVISERFQITSINVTDLYGDEIQLPVEAETSVMVSCRVKANETNVNQSAILLAAAYNGTQLINTSLSDVTKLDGTAQDIGTYLAITPEINKIKAYLWDSVSGLYPLVQNSDTSSTSFNVTEILVDGTSVNLNNFTAKNNVYTYNETIEIPVNQLYAPKIEVHTDNVSARCEIKCNDTFPLTTKSNDGTKITEMTATISLGNNIMTYKFNVSQKAPSVIDPIMTKWSSSTKTDTSTVTFGLDTEGDYKIALDVMREADYSTLTSNALYTRENIIKESKLSSKNRTEISKTEWPKDYVSVYTNYEYPIADVSPEVIGATIIKIPIQNDSKGYAKYGDSVRTGTDGTNVDLTNEVMSFNINRDATVYVWGQSTTNATNLVSNDWTASEYNGFAYLQVASGSNGMAEQRRGCWYEKSFKIPQNDEDGLIKVSIPAGFRCPVVLVKFDDNQSDSIISNAKYTDLDKSNDATIIPVYNPIPYSDDFTPSSATLATDFIYYDKCFTNRNWMVYEYDEDVIGGEMFALPINKRETNIDSIESISFDLTKSADVYFIIHAGGLDESDWMKVKPEWFTDGWRFVGFESLTNNENPVKSIYVEGQTSPVQKLADKTSIVKHFEVPDGKTVNVTLDKLGDFSASGLNTANKKIMVLVKACENN